MARLSKGQTHRLNVWIEQNHSQFEGKTQVEMAAIASEALGFHVPKSCVIDALEVLEIVIVHPSRVAFTRSTISARLDELERRFSVFAEEVIKNCNALQNVHQSLQGQCNQLASEVQALRLIVDRREGNGAIHPTLERRENHESIR